LRIPGIPGANDAIVPLTLEPWPFSPLRLGLWPRVLLVTSLTALDGPLGTSLAGPNGLVSPMWERDARPVTECR
jgi:hypothetical protein